MRSRLMLPVGTATAAPVLADMLPRRRGTRMQAAGPSDGDGPTPDDEDNGDTDEGPVLEHVKRVRGDPVGEQEDEEDDESR